ncbi:helix-turn-helix domain-containing protein [Microbacterium sp. ARD32]|uniref:TetR/AcrR family transcriptional regulator n=1 Tax=Microbacterium sp. ARD32 TaxID=2962577 RepID=UPI002880FAF4|nr:helix-turn-helix domain-containing protein [Microbacterium sp. ARD32]MDT0158465.1 helix-turn-helix domain-containing protein [Microbacterium sp. ARD32]
MTEDDTRRPRADAQRNRERLLHAAREAFSEARRTGRPATLDRIAQQAGVGIGTLYRHFPTRDALTEALYRDDVEQLCESAGALAARMPADRALREWMNRMADHVDAKHELGDALRALIDTGVVTAPASRRRLAGAIDLLVRAGREDGTLRADVSPDDVITAIVGLIMATEVAGGRAQLDRLFDLLLHALIAHAGDVPALE